MVWQPIETAPGNGTPILLCRRNPNRVRVWGAVVLRRWDQEGFWYTQIAGNYGQDENFIGWQPIPQPDQESK